MLLKSSNRTMLSVAGALSLLMLPLAAVADNFDDGVKYFNKRDFKDAAVFFDKAVTDTPWDAKVLYYQAVTHQYNRDFKGATQIYEKIVDKFPETEAAKNATAALRVLDPAFLRRKPSQGSGNTTDSGSHATAGETSQTFNVEVQSPAQTRIPFTRSGNTMFVDGQINNRSTRFEFSGDETLMSAKDAVALGIADRNHPPAAGAKIPVTIKVGDVTEKGLPVTIMDVPKPKLGDDFMASFAYSQEGNYLSLKRRGAGGQHTGFDLPFRKRGNDLIITINVNGRNCEVAFDKDASECVVPSSQSRQFGLDVETTQRMNGFMPGHPSGPMRGEPGFGEIVTTSVASAKVVVGPVSNPECGFKVDDKAREAKVGPAVFGGWHYDIDPGANVIHLSR